MLPAAAVDGTTDNVAAAWHNLHSKRRPFVHRRRAPFFALAYSYGAATSNNGQVTSITDNVDNGRSVTYTYDALYRLKIAETVGSANFPKWGLEWTYDRYGNRTAQSTYSGCQAPMVCPTSSFAVSTTTNRITDTGYSYDANGNMTADGRNALAYDAENRLITNTYQGATTAYAHDGAGLRVKKCAPNCTSPTSTTVYVFSGAKVIAEYENGAAVGSPTREYIYSGSALIAIHEGSSLKYQMADHLSARVVTDGNGNVLEQRAHFSYGELWYAKDGAGNNITPDRWQFTSYERDAESLNDYAIFRSYINRFGRFNQPDPVSGSITNPQSLNRYAYVQNDPVNLTDPLGLWVGGPGWAYDNMVTTLRGVNGVRGWQMPDNWTILAVAAVGTNVPSLDGRFVYSGTNAVALLWSPAGPQGDGPGGGQINPRIPPPPPPGYEECKNGLAAANKGFDAVGRALQSWDIVAAAAAKHGISANILAAIGVRESGFLNIRQKDGLGRGIFQIDLGQHPNVTDAQAMNPSFAAN
jgi:RHS repeat-associated protein